MSTMNLGLSALMEAIYQSEAAMEASELLFESFEDTIDDEDEEKYKKLVALIPEDGDDAEETADELAESLMMEADNLGLYF